MGAWEMGSNHDVQQVATTFHYKSQKQQPQSVHITVP